MLHRTIYAPAHGMTDRAAGIRLSLERKAEVTTGDACSFRDRDIILTGCRRIRRYRHGGAAHPTERVSAPLEKWRRGVASRILFAIAIAAGNSLLSCACRQAMFDLHWRVTEEVFDAPGSQGFNHACNHLPVDGLPGDVHRRALQTSKLRDGRLIVRPHAQILLMTRDRSRSRIGCKKMEEGTRMLRFRRLMAALVAGGAACALIGCQATSTAGAYRPANCAMVGSSCSGR